MCLPWHLFRLSVIVFFHVSHAIIQSNAFEETNGYQPHSAVRMIRADMSKTIFIHPILLQVHTYRQQHTQHNKSQPSMVHWPSLFVGSAVSGTMFLVLHEQLSHRSRLSKKWKLREMADEHLSQAWQQIRQARSSSGDKQQVRV